MEQQTQRLGELTVEMLQELASALPPFPWRLDGERLLDYEGHLLGTVQIANPLVRQVIEGAAEVLDVVNVTIAVRTVDWSAERARLEAAHADELAMVKHIFQAAIEQHVSYPLLTTKERDMAALYTVDAATAQRYGLIAGRHYRVANGALLDTTTEARHYMLPVELLIPIGENER